jgi:flagellar hook-length control protein FliK
LLAKYSSAETSTSFSEATQDPLALSEALTEEALADMLNLTPSLVTVGETLVLTAVHLGPHLQVITPQTAAPEGQSLEVFARSQGLDEAALQWLMGQSSAVHITNTTPTNTPSASASASTSASAPGSEIAPASVLAPATLLAPASVLAPATFSVPAQLPSAPARLTAPTASGSQVLAGLDLTLPTPSGTSLPPAATAEMSKALMASETILPNKPVIGSVSGADLDGGAMKSETLLQQESEPSLEPLEITHLKVQSVSDLIKNPPTWAAASTTASEWLQGNTLAVQLVKAHVSSKSEATPAPLDLSALLPADLQGTLESMAMDGFASGQDSPPQGQGQLNARADANPLTRTDSTSHAMNTAEQDSAQRRENISTLAEKMGQAVGQRILSELERGQWHLKLSLRPATLGHIEVEMRMRSGEMDAVFTAPQALTRELLNEGMSKLKDTLNQMGMDVASLKVDDGQSRQRGGESTPDRQAQLKDNAPTESADAPVSSSFAAPNKMGTDGWDVLV